MAQNDTDHNLVAMKEHWRDTRISTNPEMAQTYAMISIAKSLERIANSMERQELDK